MTRDHRRPGGDRLPPGPRRGNDAEHDFHRRRLCQRPRDLRGSPGRRPGEPGLGRRQLPREEGGLAGPARQGTLPGSSRDQASRRRRRRSRPGGRRSPGARTGGDRRIPALATAIGHGAGEQPDRQPSGQRGDLREQEGDPGAGSGQPQTGRGARTERGHQQGRSRRAPADGQGGRGGRRASPAAGLREPGLPGPSPPAGQRARPDRGPAGSRTDLFRSPDGAVQPGPDHGPDRPAPGQGTRYRHSTPVPG